MAYEESPQKRTLEERVRTLRAVTADFLSTIPAQPDGAHEGQVVFHVNEDGALTVNGAFAFKARSVPPLQHAYTTPPQGVQLTVADIQHARDQLDAARYAVPRPFARPEPLPWQTRKERD